MCPMRLCAQVGKNIQKARKSQGLSQDSLAVKAGIDRSYLSEIENGRVNVSLIILDQIAVALDTKITALFDGYKPQTK